MNRIPAFTGDVSAWAREMILRNLDYHIDDDPREIIHVCGEFHLPTFSAEECETLRTITDAFTEEQREKYFEYTVAQMHIAHHWPKWPTYEGDAGAWCRKLWELGFQISIIDGPINFEMSEDEWDAFSRFFEAWSDPERIAFHEVTRELYEAECDSAQRALDELHSGKKQTTK